MSEGGVVYDINPVAQRPLPGLEDFEDPELKKAALFTIIHQALLKNPLDDGPILEAIKERLRVNKQEAQRLLDELAQEVYNLVKNTLIGTDGIVTPEVLLKVSKEHNIPVEVVSYLNFSERISVIGEGVYKGFGEG